MSMALKSESAERAKAFSFKMSAEEYHKRPELSNSGNNIIINESPAHYKYYLANPKPQTPAQALGELVHTALLEPEVFFDTAIAMPECDRRTKAGKEFYEKFMIDNQDKAVMSCDVFEQVRGMIGSVLAHPKAKALLQRNHNELSFFGELAGVKVRCRPDILRQGNLIADLKTCEDASARGFQKAFANFNYHRQAAFYCDVVAQITGEKYDTFSIIAVEKAAPYAVQVFAIDEDTLARGREEYLRGIAIYQECLTTNKWPAYSDDVVPLNLPPWR